MANTFVSGTSVTVNGSRQHWVSHVHVERIDDNTAIATGDVSTKPITITYTGSVVNEMGDMEAAKPWLNDVRRDLVKKYISIYGDVVFNTRKSCKEYVDTMLKLKADGMSTADIARELGISYSTVRKYIGADNPKAGKGFYLLVDPAFLTTLRSAGFTVSDDGTVIFITGDSVNISGMLQVDAVKAIAKVKTKVDKSLKTEREAIKKMLDVLIA